MVACILAWLLFFYTTLYPFCLRHESVNYFPQQNFHRAGAAICTIQKDGVKYLDEWVDYNFAIGFEKIYIYDNSDNFELRKWYEGRSRNADQIDIKHFPGEARQMESIGDCGKAIHRTRSHSWIAFIDIDEFIVFKESPKKYNNIMDLLDTVSPSAGGLAINWEYFSFNNQTKYEPKPVTKRFQSRGNLTHAFVKTIARTSKFASEGSNPHFVVYKDGADSVDTSGNKLHEEPWHNPKLTADVAVLQHFYTKSIEEFQLRCARGRADIAKQNDLTVPLYCMNKTEIMTQHPEAKDRVFDDSAWQLLKESLPEVYAKYDDEDIFN
eukprot:scaffold1760_cov181-Chaetoceros_neogracile.AAC.5